MRRLTRSEFQEELMREMDEAGAREIDFMMLNQAAGLPLYVGICKDVWDGAFRDEACANIGDWVVC